MDHCGSPRGRPSSSDSIVWNKHREATGMNHFTKILWSASLCLPGLLPGHWFLYVILSLLASSKSNIMCWRVYPFTLGAGASGGRRYASALYPQPPGPAEWKWGSPRLGERGCTGGTAVSPWGLWFLSPWFHSILMTFQKFCGLQNCFHSFILLLKF